MVLQFCNIDRVAFEDWARGFPKRPLLAVFRVQITPNFWLVVPVRAKVSSLDTVHLSLIISLLIPPHLFSDSSFWDCCINAFLTIPLPEGVFQLFPQLAFDYYFCSVADEFVFRERHYLCLYCIWGVDSVST